MHMVCDISLMHMHLFKSCNRHTVLGEDPCSILYPQQTFLLTKTWGELYLMKNRFRGDCIKNFSFDSINWNQLFFWKWHAITRINLQNAYNDFEDYTNLLEWKLWTLFKAVETLEIVFFINTKCITYYIFAVCRQSPGMAWKQH